MTVKEKMDIADVTGTLKNNAFLWKMPRRSQGAAHPSGYSQANRYSSSCQSDLENGPKAV